MKLRKIIASATLSVCLATSAVIATTSLSKTGAYAATQPVNTSGIVSTVVKSGNNAAVSYGENVDGTGKAFTGLKLTGSSGAKFDLGTIDLSKSYWNGVDMTYGTEKPASGLSAAAKAEMELKDGSETGDYNKFLYDESTENVNGKYYNGSDTYANFIAFAFAPHVNRYQSAQTQKELQSFNITLTDVNDSSNFILINSDEQGDNNNNSRNLLVRGNNQKLAGMRKSSPSNGPRLYNGLRVRMFDAGSADQIPYELCYKQNWSATSAAEREPALYSPNGSAANPNIAGTWLIRKFAKTSYVDNNVKDTSAWSGFSSSKVNITVTFNNVRTVSDLTDSSKSNDGITSLVITSLGGYDLTVPTQEIDLSAGSELKASGKNPEMVAFNSEISVYAPNNTHRFGATVATDATTKVLFADREIANLTYGSDGVSTAKLTLNKEGVYVLKHTVGDKVLTEQIRCESGDKYSVATIASDFKNSNGATAAYGAKTVTNVGGKDYYLNNKEEAKKTYKGLVLTGGSNATFKYDKAIDVSYFRWNGVNNFNSLFEFAITPDGNTRGKAAKKDNSGDWTIAIGDLKSITFILEDSEDSSKKVTLTYSGGEITEDQSVEKSTVKAAANGQKEAAFRAVGPGAKTNTYQGFVPKETGFNGNVKEPTKVIYDNSKKSIYSNVVFQTYTGDSYLIRDFSNGETGFGDAWDGFTSGKVKLTVQFGTLFAENEELVMSDIYKEPLGIAKETKATAYRVEGSGELTQTSIVLTSLAGLDLTNEEFAVTHENDIVTYKNQGDDTLFDPENKRATVNDEIKFPNVEQYNSLSGKVDFVGAYKFIDPNNEVIMSGEYADNITVSSEALKNHGRGEYTYILTSAYNVTYEVKYAVGAILTAEINEHADLYLNGKKYSDGDEVVVFNDDISVRVELNEGYQIDGYSIDEKEFSQNNAAFYLSASEITASNILKLAVSATEYKIGFKFFDETVDAIADQIFTVETRADNEKNALVVPTVEGKSFTGWFLNGKKINSVKDLELKNYIKEDEYHDNRLIGAFGEKRTTITYVVDGETSYGYKFDGAAFEKYVPQKDGYVFEGWFDENDNEVNLANVTADVKVYAKFTPAGGIPVGDKEEAGVNDGEANVIDAEIKEPYYIGVVELISFGLVVIGLAGAIVGLIFFLKKNKAGAKIATDGKNADEINKNEGEQE